MRHVVWMSLVLGSSAVPAAAPAQALATPPSKPVAPPDSTYNFGLRQLAIGAAGIVVISAIDPAIARGLHNAASAGTLNTDRQLDRFGDATGTVPIIGGIALTGLITKNRAMTRAALHAAESVLLAGLVVQGSKYVVGRTRPVGDPDLDGSDFHSFGAATPAFPSGHAADAFALATSLSDAVGRKWATVGVYALATGTAWARLSEEQHWLSDVVAGAAVGIVSAKFVSGRLRVFGMRAPHFIVGPQGMGMRWSF
jgi:membrane-associated phospholipid phosphatase